MFNYIDHNVSAMSAPSSGDIIIKFQMYKVARWAGNKVIAMVTKQSRSYEGHEVKVTKNCFDLWDATGYFQVSRDEWYDDYGKSLYIYG